MPCESSSHLRLVLRGQLSPNFETTLSPARNTVLKAAPLQIMGIVHQLPNKRVSSPTPVVCVPRSDFLSECCKLVRRLLSALCQLMLQFHVLPGQPLQSSRELLMYCSHRFICHLRVSGTRCLSNDSGPPTNTGSSSETPRLQRKPLHQ